MGVPTGVTIYVKTQSLQKNGSQQKWLHEALPRDIIQHERDLIQVYLTTLQKEGIVLISKEDSQKMYRAALRWYLGITLGLSLTISSIPKEQTLACNSLETLYNRCMDSIVALASSEFPTNV